MSLTMFVLWLVQLRTSDAGIVDVAWGLGVGVLSLFFAWGVDSGDLTRRILIASLALIWALRLSLYILWRVLTAEEDGRYTTLKKDWGSKAQLKMFLFYQYQAIASLLFALPMLIASYSTEEIGVFDYLAVTVWLIAIVGESLSDYQLAKFRGNPVNQGQVCSQGLWRYSRHPNYFFEWLHWSTYVFLSIAAPWGWLTVLGPILMLYFILYVTGVPPTEKQALQSRGDRYLEYQKTTSVFFPWMPKKI